MEQRKVRKIVVDSRMINHSGIGRYTKELILAAKSFDPAVTLISTAETEKHLIEFGGSMILFSSGIYSLKEQLEFFYKIPRCDLFISPHYNVPLFAPNVRRRMVFIPDVNHLVFNEGFSFAKKMYAKFFYRYATKSDAVHTISQFSKDEIVRFTKCNPEKVLVSLLAIDRKCFSASNAIDTIKSVESRFSEIRDYLLFVGNVKPHKNLKRCLEAFEILLSQFPSLKFVIVGKREKLLNSDEESIRLVEATPKIRDKVVFTGFVSDQELSQLYKNAKCLLFPSLYEGFGLPPLEAMHFDCPVVSSREGALPEVCGNAAQYCNAKSSTDIAEKTSGLLRSDILRSELIHNGRERVKMFTWDEFQRGTRSTIQRLIGV